MKILISTTLLSTLAITGCAIDGEPEQAVSAVTAAPPHCVAPWGVDWSDTLGVTSADLVTPFCANVVAGDRYVPEVLWITNTADGVEGHPVLYPGGYVPSSRAPATDFLHKLDQVRYVVHPGGQQYVFRGQDIEKVVTVGDLLRGSGDYDPAELAKPAIALLGTLPALTPGAYTADIHFVMSAAHCDGQTADRDNSCLQAGDTYLLTRHFTVAR
jgi:hypothetical protein